MSEMALFLGVAAMLCAAYALHGGWLAERWGVDPGRQTPALLCASHKRRMGSAAVSLISMAACLWMSLTMYIYIWDQNPDVLEVGVFAAALCALVCGTLSFAVLFVCVRTGENLAQTAGKELFSAAEGLLHVLSAMSMLSLSGIIASLLIGSLSEYMMPAYGAVGWLSLSAATAAQRTAPVIRSEKSMKPAAYGSAVCVGLITLALCMGVENDEFFVSPLWTAASFAMILLAFVYPACLAGDALRGLRKSPLPGRKGAPGWTWTVLCFAIAAALGALCGKWLILAAVVTGACYALLVVITCTKWFHRIGRGLFSGN